MAQETRPKTHSPWWNRRQPIPLLQIRFHVANSLVTKKSSSSWRSFSKSLKYVALSAIYSEQEQNIQEKTKQKMRMTASDIQDRIPFQLCLHVKVLAIDSKKVKRLFDKTFLSKTFVHRKKSCFNRSCTKRPLSKKMKLNLPRYECHLDVMFGWHGCIVWHCSPPYCCRDRKKNSHWWISVDLAHKTQPPAM